MSGPTAAPIPPHLRRAEVERLYAEHDYMTAYRLHTDLRVLADPHAAVGSLWDEIGTLQFEYLRRDGLRPDHDLLDLGCGTLRGGRHFIRYLDAGRYTGLDISPEALAYAAGLVEAEGLSAKRPRLLLGAVDHLRLVEVGAAGFDAVLAQSVFTHLPEPLIDECFANLGRVMKDDARFYFTFAESPEPLRRTVKDFSYPFAFFESRARAHGLRAERRDDYGHPRDQVMAVARREGGPRA